MSSDTEVPFSRRTADGWRNDFNKLLMFLS